MTANVVVQFSDWKVDIDVRTGKHLSATAASVSTNVEQTQNI